MFVHRIAQPVDARVGADGFVVGIDTNNLVVFVHTILCHIVRVQNSQAAACTPNSLFRLAAMVASPLVLVDATVTWLAIVYTLRQWLLAGPTLHTNAVDYEALFCLVAEVTSFVWPSRLGGSVNHGELAVLPRSHAHEKANSVGLLTAP